MTIVMENMRRSLGGPDAPAVYVIGLGGMAISGGPPEDQSIRTIHAALEAGVTLIDTANVYCLDSSSIGYNERLIAKALASSPHHTQDIIVASKGGLTRPEGRWERDGRPEQLVNACNQSLKALGVETIDLYQLHAPDPSIPFAESVGALERLRHEGKIRMIGLSNVTVDHIKIAQAVAPIATVQNRYNPFFWEGMETGALEYCTRQHIGYLAYSPVGGGRLNKKLSDHPIANAVAKRHGASPHAVILAWLLTKSPVVIPIPGASQPAHAQDSARATSLTLSPQDLQDLERADFSKE